MRKTTHGSSCCGLLGALRALPHTFGRTLGHMLALACFISLVILPPLPLLGTPSAFSAEAAVVPTKTFTAAQLKKMSVFIANFTEQGIEQYPGGEVKGDALLVLFALRHNYINNFQSRISTCTAKDCPLGSYSYTLDGRYVRESIKRYFNYDIKSLPDIDIDSHRFHYDGKVYHFVCGDGEMYHEPHITKAEYLSDGTIRMTGEMRDPSDSGHASAKITAIATPHVWKGKQAWALRTLRIQ